MSASACVLRPKRFQVEGFDHRIDSRKKISRWITAATNTKTDPTISSAVFMVPSMARRLLVQRDLAVDVHQRAPAHLAGDHPLGDLARRVEADGRREGVEHRDIQV